jgi:hypothetical protein
LSASTGNKQKQEALLVVVPLNPDARRGLLQRRDYWGLTQVKNPCGKLTFDFLLERVKEFSC